MASMRSENFWARVVELDLEECIPAMKTRGLTTFAKFAFGSNYTPQQADATMLTDQLLKPLAGENDSLIPPMRMLWWESWGMATADMKRAAEGSEGDAPRKLSAMEIETRRTIVLDRLVGMTLTPELDVSDALITMCVAMYDGNRLRYIPWELCTTRSLEMVGQKRDETFTRDPSTGFLKVAEVPPTARADLATDLKIDLALRRRGLALEMADAMSWECHEKIREVLMSALARRQPPGYGQLSVAMIRKADEEAFAVMAKCTCTGIKKLEGKRPLDASIQDILSSRDFNLAFQPLPGRGQAEMAHGNPKRDHEEADGANSRNQRKKKAKMAYPQAQPVGQYSGTSSGGGRKGEGKNKGKINGGKLPMQLRVQGASGTDAEGNPVCFSYNLGGCSAAPPGGKCPKGRHICILTKCGQAAHGYSSTHK